VSPPPNVYLSPSDRHILEYESAPLRMSWKKSGSEETERWQLMTRAKLAELSGYSCGDAVHIDVNENQTHQDKNGISRRSMYLCSAERNDIPVHFIWCPDIAGDRDLPVIICLQGTHCGAHLSWADVRDPLDHMRIAQGYAMAIDAAERGYLAVCVENSCCGERLERKIEPRSIDPCVDAVHHTLLLGRTLLGDQARDVSSVVTYLLFNAPDLSIDSNRIYIMGHSSGGTVALFTAALDTRISGVIASGCIGLMRDTIGRRRDASGHNVIPGILNWMELDDIVGLCAPRPFITISGEADHIWPFSGAMRVVQSANRIYEVFNAKDQLKAVSAKGSHQFHRKVAWETFDQMFHGA